MTPAELAKLTADRNRARFLMRQQQQAEATETAIDAVQDARYGRYEAEAELHYTADGEPITHLLTNAGLQTGQPIELIDGAADAMPRFVPTEADDPVLPGVEPAWGVLVVRRAYIGTQTVYYPPKEAEYSDPVAARWCLVYRSGLYPIPPKWNPAQTIRYCEGGSRFLCGVTQYGDPRTNRDKDHYCRTSLQNWRFIPTTNSIILRGGISGYCHYAFCGFLSEENRYYSLGGIVIGQFMLSPDGISATPSAPAIPLPRVNNKVRDPQYPEYQAPYGDLWLPCSVEQGDEVDMQWTHLETIQVSDYIPPREIVPYRPGGSYPLDRFESQYWLLTGQGAVLVHTVTDYQYPPEFDDPRYYQKPVRVWSAVDEQGVIHVDFKIDEIVTFGELEERVETRLKHFQVRGLAVSEVEKSASWRRCLTNTTSNQPLPPEAGQHPCVATYQADSSVNIAEVERRLFRTSTLTIEQIKAGSTQKIDVFTLPVGEACELPIQPETVDLVLPPIDLGAMIGSDPKDYGVGVLGFSYYG